MSGNFNVVTAADGDFTIISVSDGTQPPKFYLNGSSAGANTSSINAITNCNGYAMVVVDPIACDTAKKLIADWGHRLGFGPKLTASEAVEKTLPQIIDLYT